MRNIPSRSMSQLMQKNSMEKKTILAFSNQQIGEKQKEHIFTQFQVFKNCKKHTNLTLQSTMPHFRRLILDYNLIWPLTYHKNTYMWSSYAHKNHEITGKEHEFNLPQINYTSFHKIDPRLSLIWLLTYHKNTSAESIRTPNHT